MSYYTVLTANRLGRILAKLEIAVGNTSPNDPMADALDQVDLLIENSEGLASGITLFIYQNGSTLVENFPAWTEFFAFMERMLRPEHPTDHELDVEGIFCCQCGWLTDQGAYSLDGVSTAHDFLVNAISELEGVSSQNLPFNLIVFTF